MSGRGSCVMAEQELQAEGAILGLLLNFDAGSLWSVEEVVRQLSTSRLDVIDGLASLQAAGLIHRVGDFVFAALIVWMYWRLAYVPGEESSRPRERITIVSSRGERLQRSSRLISVRCRSHTSASASWESPTRVR